MIQKTTHTTAAAPDQTSAPPGSDYEKLAEENKRLQQKNDELRERNFKLFEMVENNSVQSSSNNAEAKAEVNDFVLMNMCYPYLDGSSRDQRK